MKPCKKCGSIHVDRINIELEREGSELTFSRDRGRHTEVRRIPENVAMGLERIASRVLRLLQTVPEGSVETMPDELIDLVLGKDVEYASIDPDDFKAAVTTAPGGDA